MEKTQVNMEEKEKNEIEMASINRLLSGHHEFFNFINIHDGWYRWVSGRYTLNSIDSMGETLLQSMDKFWIANHLHESKTMSSDRLVVIDYKGAYFLLRKLDGKEEFAAINSIEGVYNLRTVCWEKFHRFLEEELAHLNESNEKAKKTELAVYANLYAKPL